MQTQAFPTRSAFGNGSFRGALMGPLGGVGRFIPAAAAAPGDPQTLGAPQAALGQTAQEWYTRAKAAVAAYEELRDNVLPRIANLQARADIAAWLGTVYQDESPEYRWASVVGNITYRVAEEGVGAYNVEHRQNRVVKLENVVEEFRTKVGAAGALLPPVEPPPEPGAPQPPVTFADIGTPIAYGLGAIAFAVLIGSLIP